MTTQREKYYKYAWSKGGYRVMDFADGAEYARKELAARLRELPGMDARGINPMSLLGLLQQIVRELETP